MNKVIAGLKDNDHSVFRSVFGKYYPRLSIFLREYIKDEEIVKNILQDTFLSLWEKRSILLDDTNLNAWLYTVAKNKALKVLRHQDYVDRFAQEKGKSLNEVELNAYALESLDTSAYSFKEIEHIITKTLEGLSPQCQEIFKMSRFENNKNHDIAIILNISEKTVEANITKVTKLLKVALKDYLPLVTFLLH